MTADQATSEPQPVSQRPIVVVFMALWIVWIGALGWLRHAHPGIDHGDPTTDSNILNAGESWDREAASGGSGIWGSYGVPAVDTYRGEGKSPDWYTTYPPGAYWIHQTLKAFGIGRPGAFRVASVAISGLSVLMLFALVRRASGGAAPAAIACVLYMTARPFVEYADNLHYISLSQLTLFAALYAWTRFESARTSRASASWFIACAAAFVVDSWLTFEHALFVLAFAAIRCVWLRRPGRLAAVAVLAAMPAITLGLRLFMSRAVLGSFGAAIAVLRAKAEQRLGSATAGTGLRALVQTWGGRLAWPGSSGTLDGSDAEFAIPVVSWLIGAPLVALAMIALATWHLDAMRPVRRGVGAGLLLLLGGLTWFAFMTEHAINHRFDAMLILPGVAVTAGSLVAGGLAQRSFQPRGAPVRWLGRGLAVLVIGAWIASLQSSFAANTVMRAESEVRNAVHRRAAAAEGFADAGRALADVGRVRMFTRDAPAGRSLGRPFDNLPGGVPETLGPGEALLVPLWWPESRQAAAQAAATLGLPDALSPAIDAYLLYRPGRADTDRVELQARCGLRIERMAWRATLDAKGWTLAVLMSGDLDRLRAAGLTLRLIGARGEQEDIVAAMEIPGAGGTLDGEHALAWCTLPKSSLETLTRIDLRAVIPGRPAQGGWDLDFGRAGAAWRRSERSITWIDLPWRAGRPAPMDEPKAPPPAIER